MSTDWIILYYIKVGQNVIAEIKYKNVDLWCIYLY